MATVADAVAAGAADGHGLGLGVVALTLAAAVLHATWNALAHAGGDRLVGFALISATYTVVGAAVVPLVGLPPAYAWPAIVASAAVHVAYQVLLWRSYELGDFSQAYPIARGSAPLVVVAIELALGRTSPLLQLAGVLVISGGLLWLAVGGGRSARPSGTALACALATGAAIAVYTVIDAGAVARTPVPTYATWMFLLQGPALPVLAWALRGRTLLRTPPRAALTGVLGGLVSLAAYALVLLAQTSGATAAVAALRETSIVVGVLIGAVCFGERLGGRRVAAAAVVVLGIVVLGL